MRCQWSQDPKDQAEVETNYILIPRIFGTVTFSDEFLAGTNDEEINKIWLNYFQRIAKYTGYHGKVYASQDYRYTLHFILNTFSKCAVHPAKIKGLWVHGKSLLEPYVFGRNGPKYIMSKTWRHDDDHDHHRTKAIWDYGNGTAVFCPGVRKECHRGCLFHRKSRLIRSSSSSLTGKFSFR